MIYKCRSNKALEYIKCRLLCRDTESEKRTMQDYNRTGLRTPPVEKLRHKFRSCRYDAQLSGKMCVLRH